MKILRSRMLQRPKYVDGGRARRGEGAGIQQLPGRAARTSFRRAEQEISSTASNAILQAVKCR